MPTIGADDFMAPKVMEDGTRNFIVPFGKGHAFLYSLTDGGYWVRKFLDHSSEYSGQVIDALWEAISGEG